jgi:hypothetical protein
MPGCPHPAISLRSTLNRFTWILRNLADPSCGILKVEHFFAFEERFQGPKEIQ